MLVVRLLHLNAQKKQILEKSFMIIIKYIPFQVIINLILNRISLILNHIKEIYEIFNNAFNDRNIDMLVLTGSFSNSVILRDEINKYFPKVRILISPENSVIKCAVKMEQYNL